MDLASQFYVERGKIEARCYEAIATPGALIRIKAPRQMGKTSLMSRILRHGEQQGCLGVPLSFQVADSVVFGDLDKFLRWFAASVGRRLQIPNRLNDYWDEVFGSKDNCTAYFEEYLLPTLNKPLVLCLDEVDMVFQHLIDCRVTFLACCGTGTRWARAVSCGSGFGWWWCIRRRCIFR